MLTIQSRLEFCWKQGRIVRRYFFATLEIVADMSELEGHLLSHDGYSRLEEACITPLTVATIQVISNKNENRTMKMRYNQWPKNDERSLSEGRRATVSRYARESGTGVRHPSCVAIECLSSDLAV